MSQYNIPTKVPTPIIGAQSLASDPQSDSTYRVFYDSQVNSKAEGLKQHFSTVYLQSPLHQVKYIRLLYATIPNVTSLPSQDTDSDEYYVVRVTGSSKETMPGGTFVQTEIDRNHPLQPLTEVAPVQSAQFVLQNTAVDGTDGKTYQDGRYLFYQAEANYDLTNYYPIGITKLSEIKLEILNSKGNPVKFGDRRKVIMCWQVVCSGQG
jgi:hypothetical protein